MHRRRWRTISYLIEKFKGIYRIKAPIDINTNDFPRKINGQYEDIDLYIDCQFGNKVFYQGNSTLLAYIPSIGRGRNIIQKIQETNPSSSTYKNLGIILANSVGQIDNSYSGDNDCWKFPAIAMRDTIIRKNDRICQFEIQKIQPEIEFVEVDHLDDESRGGIGSTGTN